MKDYFITLFMNNLWGDAYVDASTLKVVAVTGVVRPRLTVTVILTDVANIDVPL